MRYIYISSGNFGAHVLQHLDPKPSLVITGTDKPGGRGMKEMIATPVKKLCIELKIPFAEVANKVDLASVIARSENDKREREGQVTKQSTDTIFLLADFGMIIPSPLLHVNNNGIWNIHPSLLPRYRGTTPVQTALMNGDKTTGVTITKMDEKIDHGPIIAQAKVTVGINETNITLQTTLAAIGAKLFNAIVGNSTQGHPQDDSSATFTKKLTKEDGYVPLPELLPYLGPIFKKYNLVHLLGEPRVVASEAKQPNIRLHNKIRALLPWPTVWTKLIDESVLKITGSVFDEESQSFTITEIERNGKKYDR